MLICSHYKEVKVVTHIVQRKPQLHISIKSFQSFHSVLFLLTHKNEAAVPPIKCCIREEIHREEERIEQKYHKKKLLKM